MVVFRSTFSILAAATIVAVAGQGDNDFKNPGVHTNCPAGTIPFKIYLNTRRAMEISEVEINKRSGDLTSKVEKVYQFSDGLNNAETYLLPNSEQYICLAQDTCFDFEFFDSFSNSPRGTWNGFFEGFLYDYQMTFAGNTFSGLREVVTFCTPGPEETFAESGSLGRSCQDDPYFSYRGKNCTEYLAVKAIRWEKCQKLLNGRKVKIWCAKKCGEIAGQGFCKFLRNKSGGGKKRKKRKKKKNNQNRKRRLLLEFLSEEGRERRIRGEGGGGGLLPEILS